MNIDTFTTISLSHFHLQCSIRAFKNKGKSTIQQEETTDIKTLAEEDSIIIDSRYTFAEATEG